MITRGLNTRGGAVTNGLNPRRNFTAPPPLTGGPIDWAVVRLGLSAVDEVRVGMNATAIVRIGLSTEEG